MVWLTQENGLLLCYLRLVGRPGTSPRRFSGRVQAMAGLWGERHWYSLYTVVHLQKTYLFEPSVACHNGWF